MRPAAGDADYAVVRPTEEECEHAVRIRRMLTGRLLADGLAAVVRLGVPDLLADGPRSAAWLAQRCGAHEPSLRRVLRGLATFDVFLEQRPDVFELTALGWTLCTHAPGSAQATALLSGDIGAACADLDATIRTGRAPLRSAGGAGFADLLRADPALRRRFDTSAAAALSLHIDGVLATLDLPPGGTVVDLGGRDATFLSYLLTTDPTLRGILLDRPEVAERAADRLARAGLAGRCEVRAGDFFDRVPGRGDVYVLRSILHNWDDERVRALLRACRRAIPAGARLIVLDLFAAEAGHSDPGYRATALADLYMLGMFGDCGRERTASQLAVLLSQAGFRVVRMSRLTSGLGTLEATPAG